jgi:hypothetical protein
MKLPDDIISFIMSYCAPSARLPSHIATERESEYARQQIMRFIRLTHVSSRWRAISLSSPRLWAEICTDSISLLQCMLERSKAVVPLALHLFGPTSWRNLHRGRRGGMGAPEVQAAYLQALNHLTRTRSLTMRELDYWRGESKGFIEKVLQSPAPLLQEVTLEGDFELPFLLFSNQAPRLRRLKLNDVSTPLLGWQALGSLSVLDLYWFQNGAEKLVHIPPLLELLRETPQLEEFCFQGRQQAFPVSRPDPVVLQRLSSFKYTGDANAWTAAFLNGLSTPVLAVCRVRGDYGGTAAADIVQRMLCSRVIVDYLSHQAGILGYASLQNVLHAGWDHYKHELQLTASNSSGRLLSEHSTTEFLFTINEHANDGRGTQAILECAVRTLALLRPHHLAVAAPVYKRDRWGSMRLDENAPAEFSTTGWLLAFPAGTPNSLRTLDVSNRSALALLIALGPTFREVLGSAQAGRRTYISKADSFFPHLENLTLRDMHLRQTIAGHRVLTHLTHALRSRREWQLVVILQDCAEYEEADIEKIRAAGYTKSIVARMPKQKKREPWEDDEEDSDDGIAHPAIWDRGY